MRLYKNSAEPGGLSQKLVEIINQLQRSAGNVIRDTPPNMALTVGGGSVALGALLSHIYGKSREKGQDKLIRNIATYQAMETPYLDENEKIKESLLRKNSSALDALLIGSSAALPTYVLASAVKNKRQQKKLGKSREEIQALREMVDSAYRQDMLKAYGVEKEEDLAALVEDLKSRAGLSEGMGKTSAPAPAPVPVPVPGGISAPALMALALGSGATAYMLGRNMMDNVDPRRDQRKKYLRQLDRLYRERASTPTIGGLPMSDEELLALEMYQAEKGKRKPKLLEEPEIAPASEKDMDSDDVKDILASL